MTHKFHYGHNGIGPTVTTHISAVRDGDFPEDDDEILKIELTRRIIRVEFLLEGLRCKLDE
jgi:hypothetical protein